MVFAVVSLICISGCIQPSPPQPEKEVSLLQTEAIELSGVQAAEKMQFIEYYSLQALNITLQTSQYTLPLETDVISNINDFSARIQVSEDALRLLEQNGFVVIHNPFNPHEEEISEQEKLRNYFKAFMWYGRMSFLLKGGPKGLVSVEDARIQTIGAALIAAEFTESQELKDKWNRIYSVTAFYVGLSDDLGPYEYIEAMNFVFKGAFDPNELTEERVGELKAKLAEYRAPQIYGGTGDCIIPPPFTPEQADQCLEATKGFRLMG